MKFKILEDDERLGVKAGEVYEGERYKYDPQEKVSLLSRVPDGHCPECNMYLDQVAHLFCEKTIPGGKWKVLRNNCFVDEDEYES